MREYSNLGEWIKDKHKTQAAFAEKMGVRQGRVSRWMSGEDGISPEYQEKIRKLGYKGPWPERQAQEAAAPAGATYVTREELAELRGAVRAHIEQWERGQEKVLRRLEALARKLGLPAEDV
jgi:transcriptional regulator with XRE-family HTH domain